MLWDGTENQMPLGFDHYDLALNYGMFGFNTQNGEILGLKSARLSGHWAHVAAVFTNGIPVPDNNKIYIDY